MIHIIVLYMICNRAGPCVMDSEPGLYIMDSGPGPYVMDLLVLRVRPRLTDQPSVEQFLGPSLVPTHGKRSDRKQTCLKSDLDKMI